MEARNGIAAGDVPGAHVRVTPTDRLRELQALIVLVPCAKKQLEIGVVLLEESFEVALDARFCPMQRLQHANRRQVAGRLALLLLTAPPEPQRRDDYHAAIDR